MENKSIIISKEIRNLIYTIRDKQVMLDSDLASLYQVETKNLNKAVKRNMKGFLFHFAFNWQMKNLKTWGSNLEPQV